MSETTDISNSDIEYLAKVLTDSVFNLGLGVPQGITKGLDDIINKKDLTKDQRIKLGWILIRIGTVCIK